MQSKNPMALLSIYNTVFQNFPAMHRSTELSILGLTNTLTKPQFVQYPPLKGGRDSLCLEYQIRHSKTHLVSIKSFALSPREIKSFALSPREILLLGHFCLHFDENWLSYTSLPLCFFL